MNIFGINFYVFCIIILTVVLYFTKEVRDEGFKNKDDLHKISYEIVH